MYYVYLLLCVSQEVINLLMKPAVDRVHLLLGCNMLPQFQCGFPFAHKQLYYTEPCTLTGTSLTSQLLAVTVHISAVCVDTLTLFSAAAVILPYQIEHGSHKEQTSPPAFIII